MTVEEVRTIALSLPGAAEGFHHGHPDFRVGKSIFGSLWPDQDRAVLRVPPPLGESLVAQDAETFRIVSNSGGMAWVSIQLPRIAPDEFRSLIEIARDQIVEKPKSSKR